MLTNPDDKIIKELAESMLARLDHCPAGLQRLDSNLLPMADFHNGLQRPNNQPPMAVFVTLGGQRWYKREGKRWEKY